MLLDYCNVNCAMDMVEEFSYISDPPVGSPGKGSVFKDWKGYSQMHLMGFNGNINGIT